MITLSMKLAADRKKLRDLLGKIRQTNRVFTIEFVKQNGEPRIINGIAKNYKQQKGTGTKAMTSKAKQANHNLFNCYEVQIAAAEVALAKQMCAEPKVKGFKAIQIDNIEKIKFSGKEYVITGNKYVFKPQAVAEYLKTIQSNAAKVSALNNRTKTP